MRSPTSCERVSERGGASSAAAEAAVQVGGFALAGVDGAFDEAQGVVEAGGELGRDDVGAEGLFGLFDPFGQFEDEVALVDLLGDGDEVA